MKKILHISKYYYPFVGGIEQTARDCVAALKDDYDQRVMAFNTSTEDETDYVDGVRVYKCGSIARISSQSIAPSYGRTLRNVFKEFDPDIVLFHYPNPYVAAFLLRNLKNSHAKLIIYWHLDITRQKFLRIFFGPQNRHLLQCADKVIVTSPNYIDGSPWLSGVRDKCIVVPSCINVQRMDLNDTIKERAETIRQENAGKTICIAVGRHTEYKGFKYLIQAARLLDDRYHIYITGEGELTESLHREAADDSKITFCGRVDDNELKALILASDIFCFPSITKNEAFGLALAEAMYYGKPAVTFTIPGSGVNYVCLNGEDGIEVENRNVQEYAAAIERLAGDAELRRQYGEAGRQRVTDNFLSTQYAQNIRELVGGIN